MRNAEAERGIIRGLCSKGVTGERREIERLMRRSEGGHWKSAHRGNSLVAYPTSCTVVCPGKADVSSGRQTHRGKTQSPVAGQQW